MSKLWFRRKRYGWGWYPASWQGWLIILVYVVALVFFIVRIDEQARGGNGILYTFFVPVFVLSAILIFVAYKTGEKPRWQWGKEKK